MGSGGGVWDPQDVLTAARLNQKTLFVDASAPTTTYSGMIWYSTDNDRYFVRNNANTAWLPVPMTFAVLTADSAVDALGSETAFGGVTVSFGANSLTVGRTIVMRLFGRHTSSATPTNPRFRVRWGGVAGTILLDSGVITAIASQTNCLVVIDIIITCRSTGTSGTVYAQGVISFNPATANTPPLRTYAMNAAGTVGTTANSATVTVNTTVSNDLVVTCFFSATTAGNTITLTNGTVSIL